MNTLSKVTPGNRRREVDIILDHLTKEGDDRPVLSPEQEERLDMIMEADQLLMKYAQPTVIKLLVNRFPEISTSTAYRIVGESKEIFNTVNMVDRDFGRRLAIKWAFEAHDLAIKKRDPKALASVVDKLIKVFGLDRDDSGKIDPEKLEQHNYILKLQITSQDGEQREQTIPLNEIDELPEAQKDQIIDDVHQNMGFDDYEEIKDREDDPEE